MTKILSLILAMALSAALFTGCGCEANVSTHPSGMITEETTKPSIAPQPTATHSTEPSESQNTLPTVTGSDPTEQGGMTGGESGNGGSGSAGGANGGSGSSNGGSDGSGSTGGTGANGTNGNSGTGSSGGSATGESSTPTEATQNGRTRNKNTAR